MEEVVKPKRIEWLDFVKGLAILFVVLDHFRFTNAITYGFTGASVSLFFLVAGFNLFRGYTKTGNKSFSAYWSKCSTLLLQYIVATVLYFLVFHQFSVLGFAESLLLFCASPPFYFCLVYFIIVVMSGICLYPMIQCTKKLWLHLLFGVVLFPLVLVFNEYSLGKITGGIGLPSVCIYGVAAFGGGYLFLAYVGMLISKYYEQIKIRALLWLLLPIALLGFAVVFKDSVWSNPPNGYLITYALGVFLMIWFSCALFPTALQWTPLRFGSNLFAYLGRKSMDIFLYHTAFLTLAKRYLATDYITDWWGVLVYVIVIALAILVGYIVTRGIGATKQLLLCWRRAGN